MAAPIGYRALYQVVMKGIDLKSGKPISNQYFLRSGQATGTPPAFDTPISGSSISTVNANFNTRYVANIVNRLNVNYQQVSCTVRKIIGWKYSTPFFPIIAGAPTLTTTHFSVAGVLPFSSPSFVYLAGMTGASAANGHTFTATPVSLNEFTVNVDTTADPWTSGGFMQQVGGSLGWQFSDLDAQAVSDVGQEPGEALPLFSDVSGRRLGSTVGKPWQGRNSYAPVSESDQLNGKLTSGALTNWQTAMTSLIAILSNGGSTGDDRDFMVFFNASFKVALTQTSPFTDFSVSDFTSVVSAHFPQPNLGSLVKRKPRLTSVIS